MATKAGGPPAPEPFSLSRWSRRKREVAGAGAPGLPDVPAALAVAPAAAVPAPGAVAAPAIATGVPDADAPAAAPDALPPVEGLTFESNFAAFMQPKVDESTKRAALKKLFGNPHFNVMDGLDIYVGDYTQPDPMPEGMLEKLAKVYEVIVEEKPAAVPEVVPTAPVADGAPTADAASLPADPEPDVNPTPVTEAGAPTASVPPAPSADATNNDATGSDAIVLPPVADRVPPASATAAAIPPTKRSAPE